MQRAGEGSRPRAGSDRSRRLSRKRRRGPRRGKTEGQGLRAGTARAALLVSGGNLELAGDCHAKPHSQGTMASSGNNSGCHEGEGWSQRPRTPGAAPSPPRHRTVTELGVRGRGGTEGAAKDSGPVRGSERRGHADNGRAATEGGLWNQREVGVTDQTTQAIAEAVSGPPSRRRPLSQQTSAGQPLWASCFLRSGSLAAEIQPQGTPGPHPAAGRKPGTRRSASATERRDMTFPTCPFIQFSSQGKIPRTPPPSDPGASGSFKNHS